LYILPLVFAVSGFAFPLGVMTYWLVSNFWTMGQQFVVIRNMPTPGSQAAKAREERLARRGKLPGTAVEETPEIEQPAQRQQPLGKSRAKKQTGKKGSK
jgi:YidC/Oxa1 family membrane protein insertase